MALLTKEERRHFPEWDDPTECIFHRVTIDLAMCDGCRLCTLACPANVLELYRDEHGKKKARVKESQRGCISCNNCRAICSTGAIGATEANDTVGYYRQLGRGALTEPRKF
jgi:formate hydrogenlyase subunit 6/NADH:ubiquinone oxidoreductase subunit I